MRKSLAIFALCLCCTGIMASQGDKNAGPNPQPAKQEQPALITPNGEQPQPQAGNEHRKADSVSPGRDAPSRWPQWTHDSTWWLVIVAALTGGVICWQSWELHTQTRHMVNKERARIDVISPVGPLELDDSPEWTKSMKVVHASARITVTNSGGTNAFNVIARAKIVGDSNGSIDSFSEKMSLLELPGTLRAGIDPINVDVVTLLVGVNHVDAVNDLSEVLYLVGNVAYEDVFGNKRSTPFRFRWKVEGMNVDEAYWDTSSWERTPEGNRAT